MKDRNKAGGATDDLSNTLLSNADRGDDRSLFRSATRDVKRLRAKPTPPPIPRPKPKVTVKRVDQHDALRAVLRERVVPNINAALDEPPLLETGDEISFRRAGTPETTLRKLRRGHFKIDAEVDLHGLTTPQARTVLREFLSSQLHRRARCVRVIHGKGLRSGPHGPVLKNLVNRDLRRMDAVIAFGTARQGDGGSGAVLVLLEVT